MESTTLIAPYPIAIPESKHFSEHQLEEIVKWFGGKGSEQFYRDTMNSLRWCLEFLGEIAERNAGGDNGALYSLRHPLNILYQCMLPKSPLLYDFPPYRSETDSNFTNY